MDSTWEQIFIRDRDRDHPIIGLYYQIKENMCRWIAYKYVFEKPKSCIEFWFTSAIGYYNYNANAAASKMITIIIHQLRIARVWNTQWTVAEMALMTRLVLCSSFNLFDMIIARVKTEGHLAGYYIHT